MKPLDTPASGAATDPWSRITHALASVVSVTRDHGAPLAVADARFARELAELDLAQAQAALLAYDATGYAAALQRVDAALTAQFDTQSPAVQRVQAALQQLGAALPAHAPVELGAALTELRNMRSVHALQPGAASSPAAPGGVEP